MTPRENRNSHEHGSFGRRVAELLSRAAGILFVCGSLAGVGEFVAQRELFGFGRRFDVAANRPQPGRDRRLRQVVRAVRDGSDSLEPAAIPTSLAVLLKAFGPTGTVLISTGLNIVLNAAVAAGNFVAGLLRR